MNMWKIAVARVAFAVVVSLAAGCGGSGTSGGGGSVDLGGGTGGGGGSGGPQTLLNVYVTWYGFNDNSCQVESDHDCNVIAFGKSDGFPTLHDVGTEGDGSYANPGTFATGADDSGSPAEFAPGTLIYIPSVRKYFIMEDQCAECGMEWDQKKAYHVDVWMGPSYGSDDTALMACEDQLTLGDGTFMGTGTIIVNPAPDLPVEPTPLFADGNCTTKVYDN
jgi:hypothetical protein